jgi:hypothetical protein
VSRAFFSGLLFICFGLTQTYCQSSDDREIGILFYNVENLFDTYDDTLKIDEEFLPQGIRGWNYTKYIQKIKRIAHVIYESGGWNPPCMIGLCEIENQHVLNDLIYKTGLSNLNYQYIHYESKDIRGIDVALLYNANEFIPLESRAIPIILAGDSRPTRDILYVFGLYKESIPLHIFVNHFPSRYGGIMQTIPKRRISAQTLADTIQHICRADLNANIIAMGDFNDNPTDSSMLFLSQQAELINISIEPETINKSPGTLKYQFEWNTFDQFFISRNMMDSTNLVCSSQHQKILDFDFLLEDDRTYTGKKPFRTYSGYKYNNGFSDHFPIWMTLKINTVKHSK